jgi:hypothetical protein
MSTIRIVFLAVLFCIPICINAQNKNDAELAVAKAWWHALAFGDANNLKKHSTKELTVTLSNGRRFTHSQMIDQIAKHDPLAKITLEWTDIIKLSPNPQTAIITGRITEMMRGTPGLFKFITILTKADSEWKVAAAQSTREIELSKRIRGAEAGNLQDYAGKYRTPAGTTLSVVVRDTSLIITDPSGAESPLEAIGPGLFEPPALHTVGNVRIVFGRDSTGRVNSLSRITNKVTTMLRIE